MGSSLKREITNILNINSSNTIGNYLGCHDIHKRFGRTEVTNIMEKLKVG